MRRREARSINRVTFVARTVVSASADAVFNWHEAPGAFQRLTPPGEPVRVIGQEGGIRDGARVSLRVGPRILSPSRIHGLLRVDRRGESTAVGDSVTIFSVSRRPPAIRSYHPGRCVLLP